MIDSKNEAQANFERAHRTGDLMLPEVTLVHFGLNPDEKQMLERVAAKFTTVNRFREPSKLHVVEAEDGTDVLAYSYFLAIVDFDRLKAEERAMILDFHKEDAAFPDEFKPANQKSRYAHHQALLAAMNMSEAEAQLRCRGIRPLKTWFAEDEEIRQLLLDQIKILENRKGSSARGDRIQRILTMYNLLHDQGWLSMEDFYQKYPLYEGSKRLFEKDLRELRQMEGGFMQYNRSNRRYELIYRGRKS